MTNITHVEIRFFTFLQSYSFKFRSLYITGSPSLVFAHSTRLAAGLMAAVGVKANRKKCSHVSMGHGHISKHWKHPGGWGNASGMHHSHILFNKYHLGYFRKVDMCYFHKLRNKFYCISLVSKFIDLKLIMSLIRGSFIIWITMVLFIHNLSNVEGRYHNHKK